MRDFILNFLAISLYLGAGILFWRRLAGVQASVNREAWISSLAAALLHAAILYFDLRAEHGLNLALTHAVSLVAWVVVALFLAVSLTKPVENLGIFIMPVAAVTVLLEWLWPSPGLRLPEASLLSLAHIIVSILAYSLLSIAVVQSLMLSIQERHLRHKRAGRLFQALPPLETMEGFMFQMISLGFFLLTLTLVSGIFFSESLFGKPLVFTHHIVLSIIAWIAFAVLLVGHYRFGWRGRGAVLLTVGGFLLLALAYFGSKFVLEILLGR